MQKDNLSETGGNPENNNAERRTPLVGDGRMEGTADPKNQSEGIRLHLLGQDPVGKESFLPQWPLNDAYWEERSNKFDPQFPLTVASDPEKETERLRETSPDPEESLSRLAFILETTDGSLDWWEKGNASTPVFPSETGKEKIGASYNVALRIIRALCETKKLWCAALPDTRTSEVWRRNLPVPKEWRRLPENLQEKVAGPEDIRVILENPQGVWGPVHEFDGRLQTFGRVGVEVLGKTYLLDPDGTFCAVSLNEWSITQNTGLTLEVCATPGFAKLAEADGKKADDRFSDAQKDAHIYQPQDEDSCLHNLDDFLRENPGRISLLFDRKEAVRKTLEEETRKIARVATRLLTSISPELEDEIRRAAQKTKGLHIKSLGLSPKGLTLEASLQTKNETVRFSLKPGGEPEVRKTPRKQSPCQRKKKGPKNGQAKGDG